MEFTKDLLEKLQIELNDIFAYIMPGAIIYMAIYLGILTDETSPFAYIKFSNDSNFINFFIFVYYLTIFRFLGIISSSTFTLFKKVFKCLFSTSISTVSELEKSICNEACQNLQIAPVIKIEDKKILFLALRSHVQEISPYSASRSYKQGALRQLRRNSIPALTFLVVVLLFKHEPSALISTLSIFATICLICILNYTAQKSRDRERLEIYSAILAKKFKSSAPNA